MKHQEYYDEDEPIMMIAFAFFVAEFGDKTQLATVSLAAEYRSFFGVWLGSAFGMAAADAAAIFIGVVAGKKTSRKSAQTYFAGLFILFGIILTIQAISS